MESLFSEEIITPQTLNILTQVNKKKAGTSAQPFWFYTYFVVLILGDNFAIQMSSRLRVTFWTTLMRN